MGIGHLISSLRLFLHTELPASKRLQAGLEEQQSSSFLGTRAITVPCHCPSYKSKIYTEVIPLCLVTLVC